MKTSFKIMGKVPVLSGALAAWLLITPYLASSSAPSQHLVSPVINQQRLNSGGSDSKTAVLDTNRRSKSQARAATTNSYANVSDNCASTTPIPTGCIRIVTQGNEPYNFSGGEPTLPGSSDSNPFWLFDSGYFTVRPCIDENSASNLDITSPIFRTGTADKFYTPNSPGAEYTPENGWVLAFKDFGVQNQDGSRKGPALPFFALYNKYRGVLRVFAYNPSTGHLTRNQVGFAIKQWKLNGSQQMKLSALLSHGTTNPNYIFYEPYENTYTDCNPILPVAVSTTQTDGWVFADFDFAGYDPGNTQTIFELSLSDFESASFNGSFSGALSGDGTFTGELGSGGPGGTTKNWGSTLTGLSSTVKSISGLVNDGGAALNFLTGFSNPAGVVGSIFTLANTASALFQPSQPQTMTGKLRFAGKLNGNITGVIDAPGTYTRAVYLGMTNDLAFDQTPGLYRTLSNVNWGIYTLRRPNHQLSLNYNYDYYYEGAYYKRTYATIQTPINLVQNPALDMSLVNTEISYVHIYPDGATTIPITNFLPVGSQAVAVDVLRSQTGSYDEYGNFQYQFLSLIGYTPNAFILRLTYQTSTGKTSILTKVYPFPEEVNQQLNSYITEGYSYARMGAPEEIDVSKSVNVYPNPFDKSAVIEYQTNQGGKLEYKILDLKGRVVISDQYLIGAGKKQFIWSGTSQGGTTVPAGMYLLELNLPGENGPTRVNKKIIKQ